VVFLFGSFVVLFFVKIAMSSEAARVRRSAWTRVAPMFAVGVTLVAASHRAQASSMQLHVESNGGGWATIADNGRILDSTGTNCGNVLYANCRDQNPVTGVVEFGTTWLDSFFRTTTIAESHIGGRLLDLSSVSLTAGAGGGFLRIWWSDVGFTSSPGPVALYTRIAGTIPAHAQLEIQAYADNSNALGSMASPVLAVPQWFTGPAAGDTRFSFEATGSYNASGPYSLTQYAYLFLPEYSAITFDWSLGGPGWDPASGQDAAHAPEPGSVWLWGSGLIGLALLFWRRRRSREFSRLPPTLAV